MKVCHAGVTAFFEAWDELESEPRLLAGVCFLMTEQGCALDKARDRITDRSLFEGSVEDYAYDQVEECIFTNDTLAALRGYFKPRNT